MKFKSTRFMRFLGGYELIFLLIVLILIGIMIFVFNQVSFIFYPIKVILSTIVAPVILAFIAYYLLNPIVNVLEKIKIPRIWGIIIIIFSIAGIITGISLLAAPAIERQVTELIKEFPGYIMHLADSIQNWLKQSFLGPYYEEGYAQVKEFLNDFMDTVGQYIGNAMKGFKGVINTVTNVVVAIITFPIVLFFLLKDGQSFKDYVIKLTPPKFRKDLNEILKNMDTQVGAYIQGQIIVALCIGTLLFIGYLIIGLDYAIILASIAAVTSVVPYLGPMIAISPAIIIAIVAGPFMILKLAIVWGAVQFLEGNFISPNVMGKTMKVHPLTIVFVLLVGGNLFGVIGVILAIPGYAILKVLTRYLFNTFKARYNYYYGEEGKYE